MNGTVEITVRLFGMQARDAGVDTVRLSFDREPTCAQVTEALDAACPAIRPSLGISRLALNHAFVSPGTLVTGADEVALIGLVGGG